MILEAAVCGAVEVYCVTLTDVSNIDIIISQNGTL